MLAAAFGDVIHVLQGLEMVHSCNLVHLNLKSSKVRVSMLPDGSRIRAVIADFGSCVPRHTCRLLA